MPAFERPIRNSLMWVYEGQTQYWGHVLTARAGLWSASTAREALAKVAATYDVRPGGLWRTLADTTGDPVINGRSPLPWPSWQRNEDYYSEGQLLWLSVDTLLRELSGDTRSLDDFARVFFGIDDGSMVTRPYEANEVFETLDSIARHDWKASIEALLYRREPGAPLEGLRRGGYRLVYRDHRSDFCRQFDVLSDQYDLRFSIGLTLGANGVIQEVMWGSAAFDARLTAGSRVTAVNGADYSESVLATAITDAHRTGGQITLSVEIRGQKRDVCVAYGEGHRFPHLEPIPGRRRLDEILEPRPRV